MAVYNLEHTLLLPVDPNQHSDDWPILTLAGVEVYPCTSAFGAADRVSLLGADAHHPLTIRGRLSSIPRGLAHMRARPSSGSELIQIDNVRQFAYGQYDDGRVEVWAAGQSGWFSLKPSRGYVDEYKGMIEAIEVLYFCADAYSVSETRSRKGAGKQKKLQAEDVFATYAASRGRNEQEACEIFKRHRRFLVASMIMGKEGVEWEKTHLWQWLGQSYPDVVAEVKRSQQPLVTPKAGSKRKRSAVRGTIEVSVASQDKQTLDSAAAARRASRNRLGTPTTTTSQATSHDESGPVGKRPRGRKGKSVLRPRQSKFVVAPAEMSMNISQATHDSPGTSLPQIPAETLSRRSAPTAIGFPQEPQSRSSRYTDLEADIIGDLVVDEGIDMSLDRNDEDDISEMEDEIIVAAGRPEKPVPIRLRKEHLVATGAGNIWTCPLDGCMHKIYAASEPESQHLIKEHYRQHVDDEDADLRMSLVKRMQAPGLPVNRLMSRIQLVAGQNGFPPPIVRRY